MKSIEIDDELYQYIVKNTEKIGESASSILRRLLSLNSAEEPLPTLTVATSNTTTETVHTLEPSQDLANVSEVQNTEQVEKTENASESIKTADYLFNYINKEELAMQRGAVGRFLLILAALYRVHPKKFALVSEIRGKGRLYFGKSADELEASGSSTKPKQIGQSPYWVITNTNTTRKKMMLTEVAKELGYSQSDAEKIRELL